MKADLLGKKLDFKRGREGIRFEIYIFVSTYHQIRTKIESVAFSRLARGKF